jgi:hypothetical protein
MDSSGGKKMDENAKSFGDKKVAKLFARLPDNYSEMSEEDQKEWRKQLAYAILEHHTK